MFENLIKKLPKFKGKHRLVRLFFSNTIKNLKDREIRGSFGLIYKIPNAKESIGFELFANGVYEREYINMIINSIPPNGLFLDIGANIGSISIPVAKLRPDIRIIAIEASPRVFSYLMHNINKNNCFNILAINRAMAQNDNEHVAFYSPTELFGKGSFSPTFTDSFEIVETLSLDTLVKKYNFQSVNFIKIDVEGFEKLVLSGGISLLKGIIRPNILFEFSAHMEGQTSDMLPGDCQKFLQDLGYTLYDVNNPLKPKILINIALTGDMMILAKSTIQN